MIYIKKIFIVLFILCFSIIFVSKNGIQLYAKDNKIYCNATVEDNFADDKVLLVLNEKASISNKIYSNKDFDAYGCVNLKDLTSYATYSIQNNIENEMINTENYKRVLSLDLNTKSKENVLMIINELIKREDVLYAGPDYQITVNSVSPNDSFIGEQWAIDDLELKQTWDYSTGTNEVIVGVMDSGIDGTHPELSSTLVRNLCRDFTSGTEVAVSNPTDPNGHGTHVAGIIGGVGNNSNGVSGVNWSVNLVSLRVFNEDGSGLVSYVGDAISYAQTKGIKILNFSGGWTGNITYNDIAFDTLIANYSGLLVCAAGNSGSNNDGTNPIYPSSYNLYNILAVGAYDSSHNRCDFSNYGSSSVDIYAPGEDILSTFSEEVCNELVTFNDGTRLCEIYAPIRNYLVDVEESGLYTWTYIKSHFKKLTGHNPVDCVVTEHHSDGYHYMDGTSMATPYVTGVAALLLSVEPELTSIQIKNAILNSSESMTITTPNGATQDVKKLNAYKAFKYVLSSNSSFFALKYGNKHFVEMIDGTSPYFMEKNGVIRLGVQSSYTYHFIISSDQPINVTIYDLNLNIISANITYSNGNCYADFYKYLTIGVYYLKISYVNETASDTVNISIYGPQHTHSYDDWVYYSRIAHIEVCDCGATGTETKAHIVRSSEIINNKANCLECGALLDLNFDIAMTFNNNVIKYSLNGSYILSSGIIVLTDEDIDSYFNGTLVFYKEDEIPQLG